MPGVIRRMEDKSFVAGGNVLFNLDTLDPMHRIRKIDLYFDLNGTKVADVDALDGDLFPRIAALIRLGNFINITGMGLWRLMRILHGRTLMDPTDIAAAGATFNMDFALEVPFRDPRQSGTDDGSLPTELVKGKSLELTFAAATVWGVGSLTVTAGTVRCAAELIHETNVPQLNRLFYIDPNSQTIQLDPGVYKECFTYEEAGTTITQAEISQVDLEVDGQQVMNNTLHEQLVHWFNSTGVRDSAAEVAVNAAVFLPFIWHEQNGKSHLTKQPGIEHKGRLQLTGSQTAPRIVIWKAVLKDEATVAQAAVATGADPRNFEAYEPAVASKSPLAKASPGGSPPKKARLMTAALPGKLRAIKPPARK